MADALTHDNISCYIDTSETGLEEDERQIASLYDIKTRVEGDKTTLSCYVASEPGLYFRFLLKYGPVWEKKKQPWAMESDQYVKTVMDGNSDFIQELDINKDANSSMNPFKVVGMFVSGKEQLCLFRWASRKDTAYEIKEEELPEGTSVDDLAGTVLAFHRCELTTERVERPEEAGPDEDDKDLMKTRGSHPRLSEYIDLGEVLQEETLDAAFKDTDYSDDVGVPSNMEDEPWLVFEFRYKSAKLLEDLGIKPKSRKRACSAENTSKRPRLSAKTTSRRAVHRDSSSDDYAPPELPSLSPEAFTPRRSARRRATSSQVPSPRILSLSPEQHYHASPAQSPRASSTLPDIAGTEVDNEVDESNMQIDERRTQTIASLDRKPKLEEVKPKLEDVKAKVEDIKPKTEDVKPKIEDVKPKKEDVKPKVEAVKPKAKRAKPATQQQSSTRKSTKVKDVISLCSSDEEVVTQPRVQTSTSPSTSASTMTSSSTTSSLSNQADFNLELPNFEPEIKPDIPSQEEKPRIPSRPVKRKGFGRGRCAEP